MVEILDSAKQILDVTERHLTLPLSITTSPSPDVSQGQLLVLLKTSVDETKSEKQLRHVSAADLNLGPEPVSLLWHLDDA